MSNPLAQLSARLRREEHPKDPDRPRLLHELAEGLEFLIAQLAKAEEERDRARSEALRSLGESAQIRAELSQAQQGFLAATEQVADLREGRRAIEGVAIEQQRALSLSMELMRRFEDEIGGLRRRVEAMEAAPPQTGSEAAHAATEGQDELRAALELHKTEAGELRAQLIQAGIEAKAAEAMHARERAGFESERQGMAGQLALLESQLRAALDESAKLREEIGERSRLGDPAAVIRMLEEQLDAARSEAASARADVSIQSAELETKDALIGALERALEQQHGSLQNLETRFAGYAQRLQELRIDRLHSSNGALPSSATFASKPEASPGGLRGMFRAMFSPPPKITPETTEEAGR
jgi:chromosome segregation ATPase